MNANVPEKVSNPFGNAPVVAAPDSAVGGALMAREAQNIAMQMMMARRFPRDVRVATDKMITEFTSPDLCKEAEYAFSRGGQEITGLSIRALEVICRNWGNMRTGSVELNRLVGRSEMMAYAQDLETGYQDERQFTVGHMRETKSGNYPVTGDRDIYEVIMNQAQRRKRACMEALIPSHVKEACEKQIHVTLKTTAQVTPDSIRALLGAFAQFNVTKEQIEKRIQRSIESMLPAQLVQLRRIYNSLRDQMSTAQDWFEPVQTEQKVAETGSQTDQVKEQLRAARAAEDAAKGTTASKEGEKREGGDPPAAGAAEGKKAEPVPEEGGDLGGYVPIFTDQSALAEIKKVKSVAKLEELWTAIVRDYDKSKREISNDLDSAMRFKRESLQQSV